MRSDNTAGAYPPISTDMIDYTAFDKAIYDLTVQAQPFTGERYVPGAGVQICFEHLHRYLLATRVIKPTDVVLDIGCGIGYGSILLTNHAKHVIAIDIDPSSTKLLQSVSEKHEIKNISVHTVDITDFEVFFNSLNYKIDVVICHEVIEHIPEKLQKELIRRIGGGAAPFSKNTIFTVSTPEKETYSSGNQENPYHIAELSREEFKALLKGSFSEVSLYEQSNGYMNLFRKVESDHKNSPSIFELGWQNKDGLIPALKEFKRPPVEYLFAIASHQVNSFLPDSSVMVDTSNQYIQERLSIAAQELRRLSSRVHSENNLKESLKEEIVNSFNDQLSKQQKELELLQEVTKRQSDHIIGLTKHSERVGVNNIELQTKMNEMHVLIERLKPWHAMGGSLLGETPELAAKEFYRLKSCEASLNSLGHRLVSIFGRFLRKLIRK